MKKPLGKKVNNTSASIYLSIGCQCASICSATTKKTAKMTYTYKRGTIKSRDFSAFFVLKYVREVVCGKFSGYGYEE